MCRLPETAGIITVALDVAGVHGGYEAKQRLSGLVRPKKEAPRDKVYPRGEFCAVKSLRTTSRSSPTIAGSPLPRQ